MDGVYKFEFDEDISQYETSNDGSSVIYISDMSSIDDTEIESFHDVDDKALVKNETKVVTETITTTEIISGTVAETILKIDKATQTYEHEFPIEIIGRAGMSVPSTALDSSKDKVSLATHVNNGKTTANNLTNGSVNTNTVNGKKDSNKKVSPSTSQLVPISNKNNSSLSAVNKKTTAIDVKKENSNSNAFNNNKNYQRNGSTTFKRTWTRQRTYQNHRTQPYQRNNNVWANQSQNYYYNRYGGPPQGNYNGYEGPPQVNYNGYEGPYFNNYNNNNNNFYAPRPWEVQHCTNQFKDRLFTGFVGFMDYLFQYDYSTDIRY